MKLLIKQRVFSWTDSFDVYDENENVKYIVEAKFAALGHQLCVFNQSKKIIGMIHQKILSFRPAFEIEVRGKTLGTIKKKFSLPTPKYEIDYKGWYVEGMDLGRGYYVFSGSDIVIQITKELFDWGDTYVLDFNDPADELDGLLLVIAIDAANCRHRLHHRLHHI